MLLAHMTIAVHDGPMQSLDQNSRPVMKPLVISLNVTFLMDKQVLYSRMGTVDPFQHTNRCPRPG